MAHCPYAQLHDLEPVLRKIRTWPAVREPSPGVFYVRRLPFLHFHIHEDRRWADARCGLTWGSQLRIDPGSDSAKRERFLKKAERYYRKTAAALGVGGSPRRQRSARIQANDER